MNSHKKILITGAGGFVGRNAVAYFLAAGYAVRAMVHRNSLSFPEHKNLEVIQGEIFDEEFLDGATKGIAAVVHLAAAKSDESDSYMTNVAGAQKLERAAQKNRVERIVVLSTLSTKIAEKGLYAITKAAADEIFLAGSIPSVILLSSVIYGDAESGVFGSIAKFARLPIVPVIGPGTVEFAPIHVSDVARALEVAISATLPQKVYEIGGPDRISFNDLIAKIADVLYGKKKVKFFHIPTALGYVIAYAGTFFMKHPPVTVSNILGSTQNIKIDTNPFVHDFGFTPISLNEGFQKIINDIHQSMGDREAKILLGYMRKGIGIAEIPDNEQIENYKAALAQYGLKPCAPSSSLFSRPGLLGFVDGISRLRYPNSNLERKLLIASALVECAPDSAETLLPRASSWAGFLREGIVLGVKSVIKTTFGFFLPRRFIRNYAK